MITLYRLALAPAQKPYRKDLLFTHNNGDFGANILVGLVFSSPKPSLANCSDTVLDVGVYVYVCCLKDLFQSQAKIAFHCCSR